MCNDVASPPVTLSKCCKQILGCASCIEAWRVSEDWEGRCPNCSTDEENVENLGITRFNDLITAANFC